MTGTLPLQKRAICCAVLLAFGSAGAACAENAPETGAPENKDGAVVVVTGMRASLESARNKKRDSDAISDSIVAQDIGKLPDQNIAEAMQRIPGIQLSLVFDGVNVAGAHSEQYYGNPHNQMNYLPLNQRYGVQLRYTF